MRQRFVCVLASLVCGLQGASAGTHLGSPPSAIVLLPGTPPGPYSAGFDEVRLHDASRSFAPLGEKGRQSRPITVGLWYPAPRGATGARVRVQDLLRFEARGPLDEPPDGARLAAREARLKGALDYLYPGRDHGGELPRILGIATLALRGTQPAPGRFPLVLLGPDPVGCALLGPLLASHGYVVAVPLLLGHDQDSPGLDARSVETTARDHEFVVGALRERTFVDPARTATVQFSFGMLGALLAQMRTGPFDCLVSLDGWDGMVRGAALFEASPFSDRGRLRVPYLRLVPRNDRFAAERSEALVESIRHAERTRLVFPQLAHADLISLGVLAHPESEEKRRGYAAASRVVLGFLDAHLKKRDEGTSILAGLEATLDAKHGVFSVERLPARPATTEQQP